MLMTPPIEVATIGMWDSLILMVMALVVFGPRRLPEIGRQIGKLMYELRKASNDFKFQMEEEWRKAEDADRRKKEEEAKSREQGTGNREQGTESGPGAVTVAGAAAAESPYAGEGVYPNVSPGEFEQEEPYPRIHAPSTGEPVAAEPPGRMAAKLEAPETETASGSASDATIPQLAGPEFSEYGIPGAAKAESPVGDTTPSSEQARNG
jgi:sec-independent protein translocase protein TatB